MRHLRLGVIGTGGMGCFHIGKLPELERVELAAVCDTDPTILARVAEENNVPGFRSHDELLAAGVCDAVLIATPHYDHPPIAIAALEKGLHVLVEKPIGVYTGQARELIHAAERFPDQVFSIMFQMRTDGFNRKARALVQEGVLGPIKRVSWYCTDWYRAQSYYDSGGWRATWKGEGGGVLINQCPHSLDALQWICGLPKRVRAFTKLGHHHQIEVEDDVTAYLEWENGATGIFVTSTGEAPGSNRIEISGDNGKLIIEKKQIRFLRTSQPVSEFTFGSDKKFSAPDWQEEEIAPASGSGEHIEITQNFVNAILDGEDLLVKGLEGLASLMLGNAMLMSGLEDRWVELPFPDSEFEAMLEKLVAESKLEKQVRTLDAAEGMEGSFH